MGSVGQLLHQVRTRGGQEKDKVVYRRSMESCPFLYGKPPSKKGQDFLDIKKKEKNVR